jgi:hypothetical protein
MYTINQFNNNDQGSSPTGSRDDLDQGTSNMVSTNTPNTLLVSLSIIQKFKRLIIPIQGVVSLNQSSPWNDVTQMLYNWGECK